MFGSKTASGIWSFIKKNYIEIHVDFDCEDDGAEHQFFCEHPWRLLWLFARQDEVVVKVTGKYVGYIDGKYGWYDVFHDEYGKKMIHFAIPKNGHWFANLEVDENSTFKLGMNTWAAFIVKRSFFHEKESKGIIIPWP